MRILLDTQIVLKLLRGTIGAEHPGLAGSLVEAATEAYASVASLWEIAMKTRLGKLDPGMPLSDIAGYMEAVRLTVLPITTAHVVAAAEPEPDTRDPFDRLLLGVCQEENLRLATIDRVLREHRLGLKV